MIDKRVWGWMFFDWASQPFYTLGLTFVFGPYFAGVALGYFLELGLEEQAAGARSQALWFWGSTLSGLFIALAAPIIGAYADTTGRRMPWLVVLSIVFITFAWALWYAFPDGSTLILSLIAFNIALIAIEFALIFTNAILPSLGTKEEMGRISGNGAALGYWGGVLSLFIMLLLFAENDTGKTLLGIEPVLGLDPATREGTRSVGPFIAIWFAIFMIPYFVYTHAPRPPSRGNMGATDAMHDLMTSLQGAYERKSLFNFLLSSMFYRDALNALYTAGGVYATLVLGWSITQIGIFGITGAVTAAVVTQIGGWFDSRYGPKPVIVTCICVLIAICLTIMGMSRTSLFGVPLAEGSSLPDIVFYICGAGIGGAGGALHSASRSMMVRHTHPDRPTETFGLFALSGKATAFAAPLLIGVFTTLTGNTRLGYAPVIVLFLLGAYLLRYVQPEGDRAEWENSFVSAP